jgi:hypothetical protein
VYGIAPTCSSRRAGRSRKLREEARVPFRSPYTRPPGPRCAGRTNGRLPSSRAPSLEALRGCWPGGLPGQGTDPAHLLEVETAGGRGGQVPGHAPDEWATVDHRHRLQAPVVIEGHSGTAGKASVSHALARALQPKPAGGSPPVEPGSIPGCKPNGHPRHELPARRGAWQSLGWGRLRERRPAVLAPAAGHDSRSTRRIGT